MQTSSTANSNTSFLKTSHNLSNEMFQCLQFCLNCASVCNQTLQHCLEMGGKHTQKEHIQGLIDCVRICEISADFLARNSESHTELCEVCSSICRNCADSCLSLEGEEMQKCAEVCNQCADSCERMSAH